MDQMKMNEEQMTELLTLYRSATPDARQLAKSILKFKELSKEEQTKTIELLTECGINSEVLKGD